MGGGRRAGFFPFFAILESDCGWPECNGSCYVRCVVCESGTPLERGEEMTMMVVHECMRGGKEIGLGKRKQVN